MRRTIVFITFLLVAGLVVVWASADGPTRRDTAETKADKAKTETKEAVKASEDYAYAQKAEFVAKMKKELAEVRKEVDRLSAKVDKSSGAAKADAKTKLKAVRAQWALTEKQLDKAERATASTWDDVKKGFTKSYGELTDSFEKTRQWISEKVAP